MSGDAPAVQFPRPELDAIPEAYRAGVAAQFAALCAQARLVDEFLLPDETEPAPVFTP